MVAHTRLYWRYEVWMLIPGYTGDMFLPVSSVTHSLVDVVSLSPFSHNICYKASWKVQSLG